MQKDEREKGKLSFIQEARREQIIQAAIETLGEIGYVKASLSKIAKKAGISTALISYHFRDKEDLMYHVLMKLMGDLSAYVLERVHKKTTPLDQLHAFIEASLAYQGTHQQKNVALIEIIFNGRTPDHIPYYLLGDSEEDPLQKELRNILRKGQKEGVFGDFHLDVMVHVIQGSIGEYMLDSGLMQKVDLETYSRELIRILDQTVKAGGED